MLVVGGKAILKSRNDLTDYGFKEGEAVTIASIDYCHCTAKITNNENIRGYVYLEQLEAITETEEVKKENFITRLFRGTSKCK